MGAYFMGAYFNVLRVLGLQNDFLKLAADDVFEENYRLWIYYKTVINKTDKEILN